MNMSLSSVAALGLTALLGISGFGYLDLRNQQNTAQERITRLQSEREQLNKQVENLQQQLKDSEKQTGEVKNRLRDNDRSMQAYQGQIETLSTCLQGVVEGMNQISQGNEGGALMSFSSVSASCREAGKIIENRDSSSSGQRPTSLTRYSDF